MVEAVIHEDLQVRGHLCADRPGRRRMHKDTTQSEHHERIQNLMEASEIAITNHLTESAVKKVSGRVPSFINFILARPSQALPFVSVTLLKRESEPFSGQEEEGLGWLQTLWPPSFV